MSVQIHDLHAKWRPDIYYCSSEPYPKARFLEDIKKRLIYIAKPHGEAVGYVVLSVLLKDGPGTYQKKQLRLESICVDEACRGQGIGKTMLGDIRALGKAFGCCQIILGVHPENDRAVSFYQKCGFHIRTINMDLTV